MQAPEPLTHVAPTAVWQAGGVVHVTAVPGVQAPAWQVSAPLHASASAHDVPSASAGYVQAPEPLSQVAPTAVRQAGGVLHVTAVPGVQAPAWQVSAPLHASASAHDVPFASAG